MDHPCLGKGEREAGSRGSGSLCCCCLPTRHHPLLPPRLSSPPPAPPRPSQLVRPGAARSSPPPPSSTACSVMLHVGGVAPPITTRVILLLISWSSLLHTFLFNHCTLMLPPLSSHHNGMVGGHGCSNSAISQIGSRHGFSVLMAVINLIGHPTNAGCEAIIVLFSCSPA